MAAVAVAIAACTDSPISASGGESTLSSEFDGLYAADYDRFWSLFDDAYSAAAQCTDQKAVVRFLAIARWIRGNAEVAEAFSGHSQAILLRDPDCYLSAAETLPEAHLDPLARFYIWPPLIIQEQEYEPVLRAALRSGHYPRTAAALGTALPLTGNADYILPTPDGGGPDPSQPSLVGVLKAASPQQLIVLPKGGSAPVAVALTPSTSMFTSYGGIVSVEQLVVEGPSRFGTRGKSLWSTYHRRLPPW